MRKLHWVEHCGFALRRKLLSTFQYLPMAQVTGEVQETPKLCAKHPLYSCSSLLPSILCKSCSSLLLSILCKSYSPLLPSIICKSCSSLTSHHTGRTLFLQPECSQTSIPLLGTCFPEFLSISIHLSKPTNNPSLQMCLSLSPSAPYLMFVCQHRVCLTQGQVGPFAMHCYF